MGRENELAQARRLLDHNRLLTLTGPGGCGKTRLSIALAARAMGGFPDGVYFVPLAAIRDPSLVLASIAQGVGLQDSRGGPLLEHLGGYLADRRLLLVLDNFEHLLSAGGFVQELLAGALVPAADRPATILPPPPAWRSWVAGENSGQGR